ncbi:MAG: urea ABC transporter permease subunit UrtB [Thiobacillus sp.]|nr:urea ABC transporter permease subunit UrtB [Thiobacillus sp.]
MKRIFAYLLPVLALTAVLSAPIPAAAQAGDTQAEPATESPPESASEPAKPSLSALLTRLGDASFDEKAAIVDEIAASGDPQAVPLLRALSGGNLYVRASDGLAAVSKGEEGSETYTSLTGDPVEAEGLEKVRVNNMLRRKVTAAVSRLGLLSPKADVRLTSARAAFLEHDEEMLPLVEEALAKETDSGVKTALQQVRAAIALTSSGVTDDAVVAAIDVIKDRGDEDARNLIKPFTESENAKIKAAAVRAANAINTSLGYWAAAQNAWYGLSLGSVLLLAAVGLAITMGVMGVINMAHGEMVMLGAYTTYVVQDVMHSIAPALDTVSLVVAVPMAFLVAGLAGVAIERSIIRFLYGRPLETLLATWGLSLVLQQTVRTIFGPTNKTVISPSWMSGAFEIGHLTVTYNRLWIIIFSLAVLGLMMALLRYTRFGLQTRAVTQNRRMAAAMGIRTDLVDAMTFGFGSGIAGIAGVALSQLDNVSPNLGQSYIIDSFMVVVFGGVGNLWGTLVGSMTLGIANKFLEPYAGAVLGKIFVLVFIILFIQRRPRGLFALKGRALEG